MKVPLVFFGMTVEGDRCENCGRLFLLKPKREDARTCSQRCASSARKRRKRAALRDSGGVGAEGEAATTLPVLT